MFNARSPAALRAEAAARYTGLAMQTQRDHSYFYRHGVPRDLLDRPIAGGLRRFPFETPSERRRPDNRERAMRQWRGQTGDNRERAMRQWQGQTGIHSDPPPTYRQDTASSMPDLVSDSSDLEPPDTAGQEWMMTGAMDDVD